MNRRSLFKSIIGAAIVPQILDAESVAGKLGFSIKDVKMVKTQFNPSNYQGALRWVNIPSTPESASPSSMHAS